MSGCTYAVSQALGVRRISGLVLTGDFIGVRRKDPCPTDTLAESCTSI